MHSLRVGFALLALLASPGFAQHMEWDGAVRLHIERCTALYRQGDLAGTIAEIVEAIRLRPDEPHFHFMLGNALYRYGALPEAAREYAAALAYDPDHFEAHMSRGFALYELGEPEQAGTEWLAAHQLEPSSPFAATAIAVALFEQGFTHEAVQRYREAISRDARYASPRELQIDIRWKQKALDAVQQLIELSGTPELER